MKAASVLALLVLLTSTVRADEYAPIEHRLEKQFEALLAAEAKTLPDSQRLTLARQYRPVGSDAYEVTVLRDTAGDEAMQTERIAFTLSGGPGNWEISGREVLDVQERLFRPAVGDEEFSRFGSFSFDREGLRITASAGTLAMDHFRGKPNRILLTAADLAYRYSPPDGLAGNPREMYRFMQGARPDDFVFEPELVELRCDPVTCDQLLRESFQDIERIDPGAADASLQAHYDRVWQARTEDRAESPFAGFRVPYRSDERSYNLRIKKRSADHWIGLRSNSDHGHEIRFWASGFGSLYGYPSEATRAAGTSPHAIEMRPDAPGRLYQLVGLDGTVKIGVVEAELLQGDVTFELEARRDLDELTYRVADLRGGGGTDLRPALTVNAVQNGKGQDLTWIRTGRSSGVIALPATISAGSRFEIRMVFETKGTIVHVNPSYSYMARSGWLPFVRYNDKIDEFGLNVVMPARYKVLCVGSKVSEEREGKFSRTRWESDAPIHFPTLIFGDYVEDSPRSKAQKSDGTEISVTIHVDKNGMQDWGIRGKQLRPLAEVAVNALNVYRELFGVDYPYSKLDLVNDPREFISGQAPASIVYLGSATFRGQAALSSSVVQDTRGIVESLVSHEVAHQWWGSLIGNANPRSYWFIESLAEYSSALFIEILESDGYRDREKARRAYLRAVDRWRKEIFQDEPLGSVEGARTLWSNGNYREAVYAKGPYAFHMLRETFGDEKLFAFLRMLGQELANREIVTRDIQEVAERAFGGVDQNGKPYTVDLEWFFDQWIRGAGTPEYHFEYDSTKTEDGKYLVRGKIRQRVVVGKNRFELPGVFYRGVVPITVLGKDKQEYDARVVVEGPETSFAFKVPAPPSAVTLNKYGQILAHPVLDDTRG